MSFSKDESGNAVFSCDHPGCHRNYIGDDNFTRSFAMMRDHGWVAICYDGWNFHDYCPDHKADATLPKVTA